MQIQPPDNVLNTSTLKPIQDAAETRNAVSKAVAAELGSAFADVVQKALQSHEDDPQAVALARQTIAKGELETPEAFIGAAENILRFGI